MKLGATNAEWLRIYFEGGEKGGRAEALRKVLADKAEDMAWTEVAVLVYIAERLEKGRKQYGVLNPQDGRDWPEEKRQEVADMLVYSACEWMVANASEKPGSA